MGKGRAKAADAGEVLDEVRKDMRAARKDNMRLKAEIVELRGRLDKVEVAVGRAGSGERVEYVATPPNVKREDPREETDQRPETE